MAGDDEFEFGQRVEFDEINRFERRKQAKIKQQQLPDADGREKGAPGTGEKMTEVDALTPEPDEIDMTGLTAHHRGGGYYEIRNAGGNVVAESVSKAKAREMGAEV